jgi:hypothetical protein
MLLSIIAVFVFVLLSAAVVGGALRHRRCTRVQENLREIGFTVYDRRGRAPDPAPPWGWLGTLRQMTQTEVLWHAFGTVGDTSVTIVELVSLSDEIPRPFTIAAVPVAANVPALSVQRERYFEFRDFFGSARVRVGDPEFDAEWVVSSPEPQFARDILGAECREWCRSLPLHCSLRLGDGAACLVHTRRTSSQQVQHMIETLLLFLDAAGLGVTQHAADPECSTDEQT